MTKLKMHSKDLTQDNIAKIQALFPNCVTEAQDANGELRLAVDFDLLKQELASDLVEGPQERYRLDWPGKREAMLLANSPIAKTLRPARDESVEFDSTENLFIEGDNLEALKLLQENYLGKVKMIYIDPPYNTGNDFVYNDDFAESSEEYFERSIQKDEAGNRLVANTESNGRYHSDWLSMMLPRLKLARNLLSDDGVIFISIDDNEQSNLKSLCDEVFGEQNFISNIVWQKKYGPANDSKTISPTHDHIVGYAKSIGLWDMGLLPRNEKQMTAFKNIDNDPRGPWRASDLSARTYNENCNYKIRGPYGDEFYPPASRSWIVSEKRFKELIDDNRITFGATGKGRPMEKKFLNEVRAGITPESWWSRDFASDNKEAKYELKRIIPENVFETPKPTKLIYRLLQVSNTKNKDIILDFFAGSSTTAHAVMQLNAEDGGNRKFIMVQLPEVVEEKHEAYKAGYKTIAEISKERIRRAGKQILEGDCHQDWNKDVGFRVLKVDSSNMKDVYYRPAELGQQDLTGMVSPIKEDRSSEDLLFQVMLDLGLELHLPITSTTVQGKEVFFVDDNLLVACFAPGISEELVLELTEHQPLRMVFADCCFGNNDSLKTNAKQIFKQRSPDTSVMGFF